MPARASSQLGEFALLRRHCTLPLTHTLLGPGDDGAVVKVAPDQHLVISTDMLVEGVHFLPKTKASDLGWKALAVNFSDLAAMGARPRWATVALSIPTQEVSDAWFAGFQRGMGALAQRWDVDVIGGDLTHGEVISVCVTVFGEVPKGKGQTLLRTGAAAGDDVWVSGEPGLAALGLAHLQKKITLTPRWRQRCLRAYNRPTPLVGLGRALRRVASAAIDISDGLLADLGHLLEKGGIAVELQREAFPSAAYQASRATGYTAFLSGGDDYELLFCAPALQRRRLMAIARKEKISLSRIGHVVRVAPKKKSPLIVIRDQAGNPLPLPTHHGYDHFSKP